MSKTKLTSLAVAEQLFQFWVQPLMKKTLSAPPTPRMTAVEKWDFAKTLHHEICLARVSKTPLVLSPEWCDKAQDFFKETEDHYRKLAKSLR